MKDDSKLFSVLALLLIVGAGVAVYFIYFNQPAPPVNEPEKGSKEERTPTNRPAVNRRESTQETARPVDPVVSKKPEQPVTLDKVIRRMLISGRVSDEGGRSLQDIRVEFQGAGELALFRGTGYTDPAGNYTLLAWERKNIRRGPGGDTGGWVYAQAPDGRAAAGESQKFALGPSANMPDIVLAQQSVIEGSVIDANGAPASFAQVTLRSQGPLRIVEETGGAASFDHRPITRSAMADDRGQYSFKKLPPGKYGLTVENGYHGAAAISTEVDASDGALHWQELKLMRQNSVRGTVLDQDGNAVEAAVVMLQKAGEVSLPEPPSIDSNDGKPGVSSLGRRDASRGSDFRTARSGWRCVTDAEGRFGFANIPDITLELKAQLGRQTVQLNQVSINQADYSLTISMGGSVAGTVRDSATNMPISRFDVRLYAGAEDPTPFERVDADADFPWHSAGRYRLSLLSEGAVSLRVSCPGYAPAVVRLTDLAANERRPGVDVALKPLCDLMLTLKSGEKLLPREPVFLIYDGRSVAESSSDEFGEVRLPAIMAADYEIRVQRADGSVLTAKLSVPAQRTHAATVSMGPK